VTSQDYRRIAEAKMESFAAARAAEEANTRPFSVTFYDEAQSRRGKGVRIAYFADAAEAEAFAAGKVCYGKPAKVVRNPAVETHA